jgi:hypothetical protein
MSRAMLFSIIADEARDNRHSEQMSICVRYLCVGIVKERFLSFIHVHDLSAAGLASAIVTALQQLGVNLEHCIGQCYDGASVMSGCYNGVQMKFQELIRHACMYVHCHAHKVNLVLVDTCQSISAASDLFGLLEAVHTFLTASTVRHDVFVKVQRDRNITVLELPKQSDTRWPSKHKGVRTFVDRFSEICATLEQLSVDGKPKERIEARGLLLQLKCSQTLFLLQVFEQCLGLTNVLSLYLQGKEVCIGSAMSLVTSTMTALQNMRDDTHFDMLLKATEEKMTVHGVAETQQAARAKRSSKAPKTLTDSIILATVGHRSTDYEEQDTDGKLPKRLYFEIVDKLVGELEAFRKK